MFSQTWLIFSPATEVSALLLLVYAVYRIVETNLGLDGDLFQSEPAFLVLCGAVPALACILLTAFHPGAAFGTAWPATSPRRLNRRTRPPPLPVPLGHTGYVAHHRYDPHMAKTSPTTARHSQRQSRPPDVALNSSPGLPSNPKPVYGKMPSPSYEPSPSYMPSPAMSVPSSAGSPISERRPSDAVSPMDARLDMRYVAPKKKKLVDAEALW